MRARLFYNADHFMQGLIALTYPGLEEPSSR